MTTPAPLGLGHSGRTQGASRGTHEVVFFLSVLSSIHGYGTIAIDMNLLDDDVEEDDLLVNVRYFEFASIHIPASHPCRCNATPRSRSYSRTLRSFYMLLRP